MAFSVMIKLQCADGSAATVRQVLAEITPLSRAEAGSLAFTAHESLEEDNVFFVYETYTDESAYQAHMRMPAFERVQAEVFPHIVARDVQTCAPIDG